MNEGEYDITDDTNTMQPIIIPHQQKIYNDEDFEKYQCEQCGDVFFKEMAFGKAH